MMAFLFPKQKYPLELFIFPDPFSPFTVSEAREGCLAMGLRVGL